MQTMDLDRSVPQAENILKRLFWPSIRSVEDVDTLATQGFWVCAIVAVVSLIPIFSGQYVLGLSLAIFFYFGAVGVRELSLYAAGAVFVFYLLNTIVGFSGGLLAVLPVLITALLLSNFRATWLASNWQHEETGAARPEMPLRLDETWGDKFADKWPRWLWPKLRIFYYVYSTAYLALAVFGLAVIYFRQHH